MKSFQVGNQVLVNIESKPNFFRFVDVAVIRTKWYDGLPLHEFGEKIYLIQFDSANLDDPKCEPIAIYRRAGTLRYFWRDETWCEFNIDLRRYKEITNRIMILENDPIRLREYTKLVKMLNRYSESRIVHYSLTRNIEQSSGKLFSAVIYRIKDNV